MATKKQTKAIEQVSEVSMTISPPDFRMLVARMVGTTPYVQNRFPQKIKQQMKEKHEAGSTAKKGTKRLPKDFDECYRGATHRTEDGWEGIPASGLRSAMVSACRLCGFKMTHAKLGVFIEADGYDEEDATPMVRITKGKPEPFETAVRLMGQGNPPDIRVRPLWRPGWEAIVRVRFDADMFTVDDVANLMLRVGMQVGIGEGRPDSKNSSGQGWGLFSLERLEDEEEIG